MQGLTACVSASGLLPKKMQIANLFIDLSQALTVVHQVSTHCLASVGYAMLCYLLSVDYDMFFDVSGGYRCR